MQAANTLGRPQRLSSFEKLAAKLTEDKTELATKLTGDNWKGNAGGGVGGGSGGGGGGGGTITTMQDGKIVNAGQCRALLASAVSARNV
jgi:hypothetical protein